MLQLRCHMHARIRQPFAHFLSCRHLFCRCTHTAHRSRALFTPHQSRHLRPRQAHSRFSCSGPAASRSCFHSAHSSSGEASHVPLHSAAVSFLAGSGLQVRAVAHWEPCSGRPPNFSRPPLQTSTSRPARGTTWLPSLVRALDVPSHARLSHRSAVSARATS